MQALKKAELAKQKHNDLPIITEEVTPKEALSLDEKHQHTAVDGSVVQEKIEPMMEPLLDQNKEQINEQTKIQNNEQIISTSSNKSSFAELSLTPQQEEVSLEKELLALDDNKKEEHTNGLKVDFEHQSQVKDEDSQLDPLPQMEKVEPISSPSASFSDEVITAKTNEVGVETASINKNFIRPQIDVEKKQLKEQEGINQVLDQKKAQAVFSSKTPQNKLRSRWMTLIVVVMFFSLLFVAYLFWMQSNNASNQFPVSAPVTAEQMPLAEVVQPAIELKEEASSMVGVESEKNLAPKSAEIQSNVDTKLTKPVLSKEFSTNNEVDKNNIKSNETSKSDTKKTVDTKIESTPKKLLTKQVGNSNEIQISKGTSVAKINPYLHDAYQAYIAGDMQNATIQYQKVLQQEPNNRDALLGLAAIALNSRQAEQAGTYYGQLLTLDPNDPEAIAGLTSLQQGDPVQSESRLKSALNQNPNAGSILFALGNLYAQQSRWSDAQQTYFRAYTTSPNNADYAFNLAISLDRLNQRKLAIDYYQRAVVLGKSGNVNFNLVKAQQRLTELENIRDK